MLDVKYLNKTYLEQIARKIITDYNPILVDKNPVSVPIEDIIENKYGLSFEHQYLSKTGDTLGCTVFQDGQVPIYDPESDKTLLISVEAGTIIIDGSLANDKSNRGRYRFTCAHELAHWILHQYYFKALLSIAMNKTVITDNRLEWQADYLGAALLMPSFPFKQGYYKLVGNRLSSKEIISTLADDFQVSKQAVEVRLREKNLMP